MGLERVCSRPVFFINEYVIPAVLLLGMLRGSRKGERREISRAAAMNLLGDRVADEVD